MARRRSRENRGMVTGRVGRFLASSVVARTYKVPGWARGEEAALGRGLWTRDTCP